MAIAPTPTVLANDHVVLRPTAPADADELFAALQERGSWTWLTVRMPDDEAGMAALVADAVAEREQGARFPWTVRTAAGEVVGWTSYGDIQPTQDRIEVGWTLYGVPWQGTVVNPATKLLLLAHAFDHLGYERVSLKTDGRNEHSQRAIRKLGATYEGTLRSFFVRPDGTRRDTVYFSILRDEWPAVRDGLTARLAAYAP